MIDLRKEPTRRPTLGRPAVTGRVLRTGRWSLRWHPRNLVVGAALTATIVGVAVAGLTTGDYPVPLSRVLASLFGQAAGTDAFIVATVRLPRLLAAVLIGAALGMSGAVFQTLSRNPLGSPDIIGFTSGAAAGAVTSIVLWQGGTATTAIAAVVAGLATALVVYLAACRRGRLAGYRLVLVGIGVGALLTSVTAYLLTRASLADAINAQVWLIGSLSGVSWDAVVVLAAGLAVLTPVTLLAGRNLRWMQLSDDCTRALGVPVDRTRLLLVVTATALTAVATAAAGPITFVALAAPQIVRRLTGGSGVSLLPAALMGALLLAAADFTAARVSRTDLPVGALTGVFGGGYLCWLLARQWRSGRS